MKMMKTIYKRAKMRRFIQKWSDKITIGEGTILLDGIKFEIRENDFRGNISIGEKCILNCEMIFESREGSIEIGDRVFINSGSRLISRNHILIGNDVVMAWGIYIYDHNSHSIYPNDRVEDISQVYQNLKRGDNITNMKNWDTVESAPIIIGDKVWIGFEAVVLKGVTIGEGAVIGARAVVTSDIPPYSVAAGNPARVIKHIK